MYTQRIQASWRVHSEESSLMTCTLKGIKHHDVYTCNMYGSLARRLGWGKLDALYRVSLLLFHFYWPQVSKLSYAGNLTRFHAFVQVAAGDWTALSRNYFDQIHLAINHLAMLPGFFFFLNVWRPEMLLPCTWQSKVYHTSIFQGAILGIH
jgi:hypothetical protein